MQTASLSPLPSDNRQLSPAPAVANAVNITTINTVKSDSTAPQLPPPQLPQSPPPQLSAVPLPPGSKPGTLGTLPAAKVATVNKSVPVPVAPAVEPVVKRSGWLVQVGAFDDEKDAKQRLDLAQSKAKDLLGRAEAFTEKTTKGDKTMFRARFAGLGKDRAEAICKQLKRNEIPCMFLKN
jgi:D-alanyl-D-alanine carboxypeptidase